MAKLCIVCHSTEPFGKEFIQDVFKEDNTFPSGRKLLEALCDVIETQLDEYAAYTKILCRECYKMCLNYDKYKSNAAIIKTTMCNLYLNSHQRASITKIVKEPEKKASPKKIVKERFVVPASKLQPLPADYQLNLGKIAAMTNTKGLTAKPLVNLKMTIGNSILTQSLATSTVKVLQPSDLSNAPNTINISEWNVNSLPNEIFSNNGESDNDNENRKMEIDEEGEVVSVSETDPIMIDSTAIKTETADESRYINSENYELLYNGSDSEQQQHTIVVDSNSSILQMMSGQKLVYENGQLALVMDNDDDDDNDDGQDSNDEESQIELQVSGDEETANAIIAAAQEQGGAFIKVESGEMYRVKSVASAGAGGPPDTAALLVAKDGDQYKCLVCDNRRGPIKMTYTCDAINMVKHMKNQHSAKVYICAVCGVIMRNRSEYASHMTEHAKVLGTTKSRSYDCEICQKSYTSRTLLQEHNNLHTGSRPYECHICEKTFASKYTRQAHLKTHQDRPRPFKCQTCGKSFLSQQNLTQHEKTHLGIKSFVCNICNKAFGTQHSLEVHGVVHSGQKSHVCDICEKAFARRAELADHTRIHTGERPFECEVCGARFSQRSNLHSHRRATHYDDKRHECPDCPKRFKRRRLLQYHIKAAHTGERPLQCDICHSTFVYPEHYKKHLKIHNGERPYYCEICGKAFNSRDNRNIHRFVHSDKKPYECLQCGASYMRKRMLVAHMNASGHLAESIVVNQPRVTKVNENLFAEKQPDVEEAIDEENDKQEENDDSAKLYTLSEDGAVIETPEEAVVNTGLEPPHITDENGSIIRFIQVKLPDGNNGWVALDN